MWVGGPGVFWRLFFLLWILGVVRFRRGCLELWLGGKGGGGGVCGMSDWVGRLDLRGY